MRSPIFLVCLALFVHCLKIIENRHGVTFFLLPLSKEIRKTHERFIQLQDVYPILCRGGRTSGNNSLVADVAGDILVNNSHRQSIGGV